MSGWIPLEKDLLTDPRFRRFVAAYHALEHEGGTGVTDERYACNGAPFSCVQCVRNCIGMLALLWMHADTHISDDDCLEMDTRELAVLLGFSDAVPMLEQCSRGTWVQDLGDRIKLPGYQAHNGMEAKERYKTQRRVAKHRKRHGVTAETQERYIDERERSQRSIGNGTALPDQTKPHHTKPNTNPSRVAREQAMNAALSTPSLNADAFTRWLDYRSRVRHKPVSTDNLVPTAERLALMTDQAAAVKHSIEADYIKLVEPQRSATPRAWSTRPTQESALAAIDAAYADSPPDEGADVGQIRIEG